VRRHPWKPLKPQRLWFPGGRKRLSLPGEWAWLKRGPRRRGGTANYVEEIAVTLSGLLGGCPPGLLRMYALLVLVTGEDTSREHVHAAWAAWRTATRPDHPSLIPFDDLTPERRALYGKHAEAIREAARRGSQ
jgi:hypothetical protein